MLATALAFSQHPPIQVTVNGTQVNFDGPGPRMRGDRGMVPLRGVLEQEGAHVDWDPSTQTVTAHRGATHVRLTIGETTASVNGSPVNLDVPALIINGTTMVPLRFIGESLGDHVRWDASDEMVMITTSGEDYAIPHQNPGGVATAGPGRTASPERPARPMRMAPLLLTKGTVVAVTLDESLSSDHNRRGDGVNATVENRSDGLPAGTRIHGYIAGIRPADGDRPGMIELRFDHMNLADGTQYAISGALIGLDDRSVNHRDGRLVARDSAPNRAAFTGYGAGAGLIVGLAGNRPIEDTAIGALIGNAIGAAQHGGAHNVHLDPGTAFGVRLNEDVRVRGRDTR
jgi:hypothetical protein